MSEAYADLGAVPPPPPPVLDADRALFLSLVMQGLKRAVTNRPADRAFLREVCPMHPAKLSEAQRAHVMRLAWRYRFWLKPWLRQAQDPDAADQLVGAGRANRKGASMSSQREAIAKPKQKGEA